MPSTFSMLYSFYVFILLFLPPTITVSYLSLPGGGITVLPAVARPGLSTATFDELSLYPVFWKETETDLESEVMAF